MKTIQIKKVRKTVTTGKQGEPRQKKKIIPKSWMDSGIIHILAIEGHDIVKHPLGLDSRAVRVKRDSLDIAVDGFVPFRLFTKGIALFVPLLSGHLSNE